MRIFHSVTRWYESSVVAFLAGRACAVVFHLQKALRPILGWLLTGQHGVQRTRSGGDSLRDRHRDRV